MGETNVHINFSTIFIQIKHLVIING